MIRHLTLAAGALAIGVPALAQQAIQTLAATQPGEGRLGLRERIIWTSYENDLEKLELSTTFDYGLRNNLALSVNVPVRYTDSEDDSEWGIGDPLAFLKWRIYQNDFGPIETARFSLIGGAELPSGDDDYSSDSIDPVVGGVYTLVAGRHGVNLDAVWKFTTGEAEDLIEPGDSTADLLRYGAAYLYRIAPEQYTAETDASWYVVAEANAFYETNGDHELFIAPGLLYEARRWAFEISVQLPVMQELDERPEAEFRLTAGVRLLF